MQPNVVSSFTIATYGLEKQVQETVATAVGQAIADLRLLSSPEELRACYAVADMMIIVVSADCLALVEELTGGQHRALKPLIVMVENATQEDAALVSGASDAYLISIQPELLGRRLHRIMLSSQVQRQISTASGRFDTLYDDAPVMMHVLRQDGRILRVNQRWLDVMGYTAEQVEGQLYVDFLRPEQQAAGIKGLEYFFQGGFVHRLSVQLRAADGNYRELILSSSIFREVDGVLTMITALHDVTDRIRSQNSERAANHLYRNLFEAATDAVLLVDEASGRILEANQSAAELVGYPVEVLQTMDIQAIDLTAPTSNPADHYYQRADGTLVPVESHSRVIQHEDRHVVLHFVRDMTVRKGLLEQERTTRMLAETLRDSIAELSRATSVDQVLDTAINMVRRVVPGPVANVSRVAGDQILLVRWIGYEAFGFDDDHMENLRVPLEIASHVVTMLLNRQPVYLPDTALVGWQESKIPTDAWVRSYIGAPIIVRGEVYGFLNVDSPLVDAFNGSHLEVIQALANQVSIALENTRLVEELKAAKVVLEETVTDRTDALISANRALRRFVEDLRHTQETLQHERGLLQLIIDSIPDMIYVKDREGRYLLLNQAAKLAMGSESQPNLIGKSMHDIFDQVYSDRHRAIDQIIITTGEPILNMDNTMTYADGSQHRQLLSKQPLYDAKHEIIGLVGINRDITKLKLVEEDLQQEREQMAQVLRSARCLLWTASLTRVDGQPVWQLTVVNEDAAQTLLPLALNGRAYSDVWPLSIMPQDAERRVQVIITHLQFNRYHFSHEIRCRSADGNVLCLAEDIQIRQLDENEWRLVGICTDITERKQAEANLQAGYDDLELMVQARMAELLQVNNTLRDEIRERQRAEEAERRQRLLAEALTQSLATLNTSFDRDALFDYLLDSIEGIVPHRAANIMLVDEASMSGQVVRQRGYSDPQTVQAKKHLIRHYPDKMHILQNNTHFIINDTRLFKAWSNASEVSWVRSTLAVPITLNDGVIGFLNVESEVPDTFTVQHAEWLMAFANQAALALRNANLVEQIRSYTANLERTVQARTAELRAMLGSIRDGLVYHMQDGEVQYVNPALVEMLGYSATDWVTKHLDYRYLLVGEPEALTRVMERIDTALSLQAYFYEEVEMRRQDDSTLPVMMTRVQVRGDENQTLGTLMVIRDISQEKILQEQRERFIANASHELRTPIANMKTRLYLMSRKPESIVENLEILVNVTNWMQQLVDNMFDLSRFQRGLLELHRDTVNVSELLREIMVFLKLEAERKDILLMLTKPTEPLMANVDPYRMMQVFSNLVSNAIHYTPMNGEVGVEIRLADTDSGQQLVITVADSGNGIKPENLDNLFKPFFRGSTDSSGAGLGLAIAQEIVAMHGGLITVESLLGIGSRFTISMPYVTEDPALDVL